MPDNASGVGTQCGRGQPTGAAGENETQPAAAAPELYHVALTTNGQSSGEIDRDG